MKLCHVTIVQYCSCICDVLIHACTSLQSLYDVIVSIFVHAGLESKPKLSELQRLVKPLLAKRWEELGTALGLADEDDGEQLDKIQENRNGDCGMCFNDTMKLWLRSTPSHQLTWATLIEAVKSIEGLETVGAQLVTSGMLDWV